MAALVCFVRAFGAHTTNFGVKPTFVSLDVLVGVITNIPNDGGLSTSTH